MTKRLRKKKRIKLEFLYINFVGKRRKARSHIWNRKCKKATKELRVWINEISTSELLNWLNRKGEGTNESSFKEKEKQEVLQNVMA